MQSSDWLTDFELLVTKSTSGAELRPGEPPFFVDVGGGRGQKCIQLLEKYSNLMGRVVLQDLPEAVDDMEPIEGIKVVAQDFFKPQAVKGARIYYLRHVLHDWPENGCIEILKNIAEAMGADSKILLDEVVLPDQNVHWQAAAADLLMMTSLGGKERTGKEWDVLAQEAGLTLIEARAYGPENGSSVLVLEKL